MIHTMIILLLNFCQLYEQGRINIVSVFCFLETDIREQKSMERKYRHPWINTVNDLHYEVKFENHVEDKNSFFVKRYIYFLF